MFIYFTSIFIKNPTPMAKPFIMGKAKATPQVEYFNINKELRHLEESTTDCHWLALLIDDSAMEGAVREVWDIINTQQLKYWMKWDSEAVFQMLDELWTQWDLGLEAIRLYNKLQKGDYKELYIITQLKLKKAQKQVSHLIKKLARFYNKLDTAQAQWETIIILLGSDTGSKVKMAELPHPSYLTDGKELTYQQWAQCMKVKLFIENDSFQNKAHQVEYMYLRTQGQAAWILNIGT